MGGCRGKALFGEQKHVINSIEDIDQRQTTYTDHNHLQKAYMQHLKMQK
jgi:hypothetical protein